MSRSIKITDDSYKKIYQIARHDGWRLGYTLDKAIHNYFLLKRPKTKKFMEK